MQASYLPWLATDAVGAAPQQFQCTGGLPHNIPFHKQWLLKWMS
jgi:hypothetical protein